MARVRFFVLGMMLWSMQVALGAVGLLVQDSSEIVMVNNLEGPDLTTIRVADTVDLLSCNQNGHYLIRDSQDRSWRLGAVSDPTKLPGEIITCPENVIEAALSNDSEKIAWIIRKELESSIWIYNRVSNSSTTIWKGEGIVTKIAWSPLDDRLAYYYGPNDAVTNDGYVLNLLTLKDNHNPEERILSSPSQRFNITPARSIAPRWSPLGDKILFQGCFGDQSQLFHLVNLSTMVINPAPLGIWSSDGTILYYLKKSVNEDKSQNYNVSRFNVNDLNEGIVDQSITSLLPATLTIGKIDKSGSFLVYSTSTKETFVLDIKNKTQKKLDRGFGVLSEFYFFEIENPANAQKSR